MKVAEAVARTLVDEGIDIVFSLLGDVNLDVVHHLKELEVPIVEGRHEASVFAMADGYSRATGKLALCSVTAGPALAHAFTPLTSAVRIGSRVILMTGERSRDDLQERQWLDHQGMTRLTGAGYFPVFSPDTAVDRVRAAIDFALAENTPLVLDVPGDVLDSEYGWEVQARQRPGWLLTQRIHPDPDAVARATAILADAERPVIIAGWGAQEAGAGDAILALASESGALLATTLNARGLFEGEPFQLGVAGLFSKRSAAELLHEADCVVAFGASLNRYTTESGYLFPDAATVQVDVKSPRSMMSGESADCYVQGDALAVANAMRRGLSNRPPRVRYRRPEVIEQLADDPDPWQVEVEPDLLDPRQVCSRLDELLPESVGWVCGNSGHFWSFAVIHMQRRRRLSLFGTYFGAIGYGMPVGLGAALGSTSEPTLVIEGDGSAMMYIHTLETAVRYGAHMLVVVLNDGALGAEFHKLSAKGYSPDLSLNPSTDFASLARSFGCRGATPTDISELDSLVAEFLADPSPMLIDARTSRRVTSLPFRRIHQGSN